MILKFSGHESFTCKQFWLKKAYDFLSQNKKFNDESTVIDLGVGKNMVSSINFWSKAFGITDEKLNFSELGDFIFGETGKDIFIEDIGTIWLLHYFLIKSEFASIYNLFFNEFRKERIEFTKDQLHNFLKRKCEELNPNLYNENTINTDINVLIRSYLKPNTTDERIDIEDEFSGLLIELNLLSRFRAIGSDNKSTEWYKIESSLRNELPYAIVLFCILDRYPDSSSITFKELEIGYNSPGSVFVMNKEGLFKKIENIIEHYPQILFSNTAGIQVLQIKSPINKWEVLEKYYGS